MSNNNEEARFAVTPSFVLTHSSDSIIYFLSDECVSTKLGVTANLASSLLLLISLRSINHHIIEFSEGTFFKYLCLSSSFLIQLRNHLRGVRVMQC